MPLLAILFTLGWIPLYYFQIEPPQFAFAQYTRAERRWALAASIAIALHTTLACVLVSFGSEPPAWRSIAGVALFAAGLALWFWGRVLLAPLGQKRLPAQPPAAVSTQGPFSFMRHPLAVGVWLAAAAPALVAGQCILLVTLGFAAVALVGRSSVEERRLTDQLGEAYTEYCRRVKRFVPFVW